MAVLNTSHPALILGSTSRYRQELLSRLRLPFLCQAPEVDESPLPGEAPADLANRLALAKAEAVAQATQQPQPRDVIVIGSDQVADLNGLAIGKPGGHEQALRQLQAMRGQTVVFHTAVAVIRPATHFRQQAMSSVRVTFRADISDEELDHYLHLDQPYDCAGSAKVESLGITLLERVDSDDPTALVGLPLIATSRLLRAAGLPLFSGISA
ncbi:Maf family nucleotide pyrophosphatase [Aquabacterium sp.]|uniref:Maf family nucleotide pyrophosphatase n=1 Tax=Aquabacterium sp. TaxID=1872578 RepID=UPI002E340224|nr:Maf family nucleotide pyrophosphatase [Aquabacterium sp.]HEX5312657.1 Maf family nucleotide pyrophosphatase [Aquabacterium sp.]